MFHHPNVELTEVQADLMEIPLLSEETLGEKEEELKDLERLISRVRGEVEGILSGAIASNYQRSRIERICHKLGLDVIVPMWHINPEKYWEDLLDAGFRIIVSAVSAEGLDESWLGRVMDEVAVKELKEIRRRHTIHLAFEGGEAETSVLNCPLFRKEIKVVEAEKNWDGQRGTYNIKKWALR